MDKLILIYKKISYFFSEIPREKFVFLFFTTLLLAIVFNLFGLTVLNHAYYENLADRQQTSQTQTPTSRGNIYSSNESGKVLATSVYLYDLAIDPSMDGDKEKLSLFLTDVVFNEICYLKSSSECKTGLKRFLGVLDIKGYKYNESYIKELIYNGVSEKVNRKKVTSVLLNDTLTTEDAYNLEKMGITGLYINGDYLYANPEEIIDYESVAKKIIDYTFYDELDNLKSVIKQRDLRYVSILSKISISSSEYIKEKMAEEDEALDGGFITDDETISGFIILSSSQQRYYPEGTLAASILGFLGSDSEGNYGIEGYFNSILKGKESSSNYKKDINGKVIDLDFISHKDDILNAGADITLTIDKNIQKAVEDIIDEDVDEYIANSVSVVVMEPKTGKVLAMATNPRFDPNNPGNAYELEKVTLEKYPDPSVDLRGMTVLAVDNVNGSEYIYNGKRVMLREIDYEELDDPDLDKYVFVNNIGAGVYKNHTIQDIYEPGSIFKPILMAVGIDSGEINRYDMYQDDGSVKIDEFTIKNVSSKCLGYNSFQNAMNFSCNVGMIRIAQRIGKSIYYKYLQSFGFGEKTGITLSGESAGNLADVETWSTAQLFTTSYGLGIGVTMLQMAAAYSTIANGGIYYTPQIVEKIEMAEGKVINYEPVADHRVLNEETSQIMTEVLVDGVVKGEAKAGAVEGYTLAGKTGTAQIAYKGKYETGEAATMASYAGYGPAEDPKFVIIVRVERPRASEWGGSTAGKTFQKIAEYLLSYYKIPPKTTEEE